MAGREGRGRAEAPSALVIIYPLPPPPCLPPPQFLPSPREQQSVSLDARRTAAVVRRTLLPQKL